MRWNAVALLAVLGAAPAWAEGKAVDRSMVVLDLAAQTPDDAHRAEATTALITAQLQKHPGSKITTSADVRNLLGVERQKQLLGCSEGSSCMAELGGALGARYIVTGQLGKLGSQILLSAAVVDARTARSLQRFAQTLESEDALPAAANTIADGIADAVGLEPIEGPPGADRGFNLDLKLGNTLPVLTGGEHVSLNSFNLRVDIELGYFVTAQTSPYLGASLALARSSDTGETLRFIPVLLGVKHYFRPQSAWQPYAGGGLGLGFLAGKLSNDSGTNTSFTLTGVGGLAFLPWKHVGFNLEASANLSGLNVSGSGLLLAYNLDFGVLFLF